MSINVSPSPSESSVSAGGTPSLYSFDSNFTGTNEETQRVTLQENTSLLDPEMPHPMYTISRYPRASRYMDYMAIEDLSSLDGSFQNTAKKTASYAVPLIGFGLLAFGIAHEHNITDPEDNTGIYCIQAGASIICLYIIFKIGSILYTQCYNKQ